MKKWNRVITLSTAGIGLALLNGCAAFQASVGTVDVNQQRHYDQKFDYTDMKNVASVMTDSMLSSKFLNEETQPPIMIFAGVRNKTTDYLDTENLSNKMRTLLFKSGAMQFVNEGRRAELLKEQGYQAANATPETQAAIGKQLGAKYMVTGTLTEMESQSPDQVRISRKKTSYYKLTAEVTNLESGLLSWTDDVEFAREASVPIIKW
ncbi:MAG: hypothetical protein AAF492_11490 [Verrucomicrobiota bacterium]